MLMRQRTLCCVPAADWTLSVIKVGLFSFLTKQIFTETVFEIKGFLLEFVMT